MKNRNDSERNAHIDTLILAVRIFAGIVFGIWKLILIIAKKHDRNVSPHLIFGIVDIVCGLIVVGFAMYDILTPGGDLNGMLGQILLLVFVPTVIVLLIADILKYSVLPQDRNVGGGYGKWIDEQKYTLIVKGETFPDRRMKQ